MVLRKIKIRARRSFLYKHKFQRIRYTRKSDNKRIKFWRAPKKFYSRYYFRNCAGRRLRNQ